MTNNGTDIVRDIALENCKSFIKTGIKPLDEGIGGLQNSNLYVIGGITGIGKTAFATTLLVNIGIKSKIPSAYISLETTFEQSYLKLVSNYCESDYFHLNNGSPDEDDIEKYQKAKDTIQKSDIYFDCLDELPIEELEKKANDYVESKGVKVIFIDYLQALSYAASPYKTRHEELEYIMRRLKSLTLRLNIPIILNVQSSRTAKLRFGYDMYRPHVTDLWGTTAIENLADTVILINRPFYRRINEDEDGNDVIEKAYVYIDKNRNSYEGEFTLKYEENFYRFTDAPGYTTDFIKHSAKETKKRT